MTARLLNYLKSLCESHKDFKHSDTGTIAYYEFDWMGLMSPGLRRANQVLYVHKVRGAYKDNLGDHKTDTAHLIFLIIQKVEQTQMSRSRNQMLACKAYGEQFKEKMRHDAENSQDAQICQLLNAVQLDEWTYEQTELQADGWIGIQFRLPFKTQYVTEYDASLWQ